MEKRLFLSNLRTSVRNLMKYKVQIAISILCLAVGIICFIILITVWEKVYRVSRTNPSEIIVKE